MVEDSQQPEDFLESPPFPEHSSDTIQDTYDRGALADNENNSDESPDEETQAPLPREAVDVANEVVPHEAIGAYSF